VQILGLGIDYSTGERLVDPLDEQEFASRIAISLEHNIDELRSVVRASTAGTTFRGEVERTVVDLGDPRSAGWTYLINANDPHRTDVIETLRPLAVHRGMSEPASPLLYNDEPVDEWADWLLENYSSLYVERVPHFVLIVGSPQQVPFHFQAFLGSAAAVGRLAFDNLDELAAYIEKVIRLETAPEPIVSRETIFFAPDGGIGDATYFSRRYMAQPLAQHVREKSQFDVTALMSDEATKANLVDSLRGHKPALVFTASHGLGSPGKPLDIQKAVNGAICCQRTNGLPVEQKEWTFSAADVPQDEPFLEGSVVFQFACFSAGTPAESDFMHWYGDSKLNSDQDFVAALPLRLLAHPRGPVAFVGHVDTAWLHGFNDPESPHLLESWHPRIDPFLRAVTALLRVEPASRAMSPMAKQFDVTNLQLTNTYDRLQRGSIKITDDFKTRLVNAFIRRSDAQNYMVLGDPAGRLRIPAAS
jgi:hypothetical protein